MVEILKLILGRDSEDAFGNVCIICRLVSIVVEKWNESNLVFKDIGLDLKRAEVVCGLHAFSERRHLRPSPLQLLVVQTLIRLYC